MTMPELPEDLRQIATDLARLQPSQNEIEPEKVFYLAGFAAGKESRARSIPVVNTPWRSLAFAGMSAVAAACLTMIAAAPISYRAGKRGALAAMAEQKSKHPKSTRESFATQRDEVAPVVDETLDVEESSIGSLVVDNGSPAQSYLELFLGSVSNQRSAATLTAFSGSGWLNEEMASGNRTPSLLAIQNVNAQITNDDYDEDNAGPFAIGDGIRSFPRGQSKE